MDAGGQASGGVDRPDTGDDLAGGSHEDWDGLGEEELHGDVRSGGSYSGSDSSHGSGTEAEHRVTEVRLRAVSFRPVRLRDSQILGGTPLTQPPPILR